MRILVVGAGPAGLYFSLLMKKANPSHEIRIVERNPAGATYGWGVVFSDRTLESFREADYRTYLEITEQFVIWDAIDIRFKDRVMRCGGQVFSGISRRLLLHILQERCAALGVELAFEQEFNASADHDDADLIVGADGVHSEVRAAHQSSFKTRLVSGASRYIWFGTRLPFDSFTFIFRVDDCGLWQAHAYPFDGSTSTFIVECSEETWRRAGLEHAGERDNVDYCEGLFADDLRGHPLLSNKSQWLNFVTVKNRSWRAGNIVLVGDAAHTAHFSIGSGTKLAMEDAIALADAFQVSGDVGRALDDYQAERKPVVERFQEAAAQSQSYFENTSRYVDFDPEQFAFHLLSRSGRMDYQSIRLRDPYFVSAVDAYVAGVAGDGRKRHVMPPPPAFTSVRLGELVLPNRAVAVQPSVYSAIDGLVGDDGRSALERAAGSGAGLVVTQHVAVSATGRVTSRCPGMYSTEQAAAWKEIVASLRSESTTKLCLSLGHSGARGATRPREDGVDAPLRDVWPLLAASELAYVRGGPVARAIDRQGMDQVCREFAAAARRGVEAGFDMLQIEMARGHLLAGFISPLTNRREDEYGGPLENRMRFPLEVLSSVRAVAGAVPVAVAISAADEERGGLDVASAVSVARALKDGGCDLVVVLAGQTTAASRPTYDRYTFASYSDKIRNEVHIATVACGHIQTMDQVSTIVAGGRADLCRVLVD